jgi:23S rRNA (guanosine2251-2'-O)-methyltransferase
MVMNSSFSNSSKDHHSTGLVAFGIQAVSEALTSGGEVNKVCIQKELRSEALNGIIALCKSKNIPFQFIPKESSVFQKNKNHQGVVAFLSPVAYHSLSDLIPTLFESGQTPFILVLDHLTDTRNFGAIARSAFCGGVHALVIPDSGSVSVTEDAIKTSAGALLKIPVCREQNFKTTMELLNQSGIKTIGLTEKANKDLPFINLTEPVALIVGNEEKGLSNEVMRKCQHLAKIPMGFGVDSLNVSVAAGIAIYERIRQGL